MDTDLFQILALILLLGLLLTLFGVLQSLGAIRRTLEGRERGEVTPASAAAATPPVETTPEPDRQPQTWAAGDAAATAAPATDEPARTGWPAPQEAAAPEPAAAEEPAITATTATAGTGARVLYGDAGLTSATPNESALRPAAEEPEPDTTAAAGGTDAQTGGAAEDAGEDPQEQPFERDGRWWFRRGDELLVYEEQSGQWVAAGDQRPGGVATAGSAGAEAGGPAATAAGPAQGQVTTQQEAVGSFWKCPSCGAVNGSTATSCRMCFTARP